MTEKESLGRIQVINGSPPNLPGKCAICGSASGKFVDFGFDMDFYGTVYFCDTCLTEVANELGFFSKEQVEILQRAKTEISSLLESAYLKIQELQSALRLNLRELVSESNPPVAALPEVEPKSVKKSAKPKLATSEPKPRLDEQVDESGFEDLFNDDYFDSESGPSI